MKIVLTLTFSAFALLLLACSSSASGTSSDSNAGGLPLDGGGGSSGGLAAGGGGNLSAIDWINFIRFDGITYLATSHSIDQRNPALSRDILGPKHDEVRFMVAGNVTDPNYQMKDGDAAFWEKGTPVYEVRGYAPETLLAAVGPERIILFEADTNPNARKGSDLLDIEGKVEAIRLLSREDGKTEVGRLGAEDAQALTAYILDAEIDQRATGMSEMVFIIEFQLRDGIVLQRAYFGGTGELSRGIFLPLTQVRPVLGPLAGAP